MHMHMQQQKGFSLLEMLMVAMLMSIIVAGTIYIMDLVAKDAIRLRFVTEQANEMYLIAKATERYVQQTKNKPPAWVGGQRHVITLPDLIASGAGLPADFAKRMRPDGVTAIGVSPFGTTYNVAAYTTAPVPPATSAITRAVVWESGAPIAWTRYAQIGIRQGSEPPNGDGLMSVVQSVKREIASTLQTQFKHPAPATAMPGFTRVNGVLQGFQQDVEPYVGKTFETPAVVVLAGWPEYGALLADPNEGGNRCTQGEIVKASCTANSGVFMGQERLCTGSGQTKNYPVCPTGKTNVSNWPHCFGYGNSGDGGAFQYNSGLGDSVILGGRRELTPTDLDCEAYASDGGSYSQGGATGDIYDSRKELCANYNKNRPGVTQYTTINVGGAQEQAANVCSYTSYHLGYIGGHLYIRTAGETWNRNGAPRDIMCAVCP